MLPNTNMFPTLYGLPSNGSKIKEWSIEVIEDDNKTSPYLIFIARDHHYSNEDFAVLKENDLINIKVLGKRYEIHDKYISIIAELITQQNEDSKEKSKKGKKQ